MLLKLNNIGKIYDSNGIYTIGLRGVNLDFNYNEFVVIQGESGSGKSTLMNIIGANDTYEEGEMFLNGQETSHYTSEDWSNYRENYITTIFQDFNIIENLTVLENVLLALFRIEDMKERKKLAMSLIEKVGLTNQAKQKTSKLSGGEKQRAVIARALAKDSPIILADEPTGNLDVKNSIEIAQLLKDVSKDKLVVVVTHNPEYFIKHCTRKIKVFDGSIIEDDRENVTNKKEMVITNDSKSNKGNIKNSLMLGTLNYKSRPKFTIMMSVAILVCVISIFFVYSVVSQLMINPLTQCIDTTPIDGKVNIYSEENIDYKDISELADNLNANYYITNRVYSEFDFTIKGVSGLSADYDITCLYSPFEYNLKYKEAVLLLPISLSSNSDEISSVIVNAGVDIDTVNIVTTISSKDIKLYLSLDNIIENGAQIKSLFSTMSIAGSSTVVHTYKINDDLENGEINLINSSLWDVVGKTVMLQIDTSIYYIIKDDKSVLQGAGLVVELCSDDYNRIFTNEVSAKEFSFYYSSDSDAVNAINDLPDKYLAVLSSSGFYKVESPSIFINNIICIIALVASVACLSALIVIIFMRSMQIFKVEFAIYKTLGINDKVAKMSFYFQMLLIFIPSIFIIPLVSIVVTMMASVPLVFVDLVSYTIIELLVLSIVLIVAFSFSSQVSKQSVRSVLARGAR
ncbi:MAG: ABC transporter ATP-binding protein [bacterium]